MTHDVEHVSLRAYFADDTVALYHGDALNVARQFASGSADCIVTSPPYYGLRDYGIEGQYGLEDSPAEYVENIRLLFAELRRVLADDGTCWINLGDSYYSGRGNPGPNAADKKQAARRGWVRPVDRPGQEWAKPKNLLGIPWRVAFALQDDGWILRNAVIWHKPNAMPESVTDRLSRRYEHVFLFSKSQRYWFDLNPIREACATQRESALNWARSTKEADIPGQLRRHHREDRTPYAPGMNKQNLKAATGRQHKLSANHPGARNPGDVWSMPTQPFAEAHFAVYPPALPTRCILAGCKPGGTVLDPFSGSGTTGYAAQQLSRKYVGIDLSRDYLDLSLRTRLLSRALDCGDCGEEVS
jgi:DNA modification methylase